MSRAPVGGKERLRTGKRRSAQSARWLTRQLNDPYVRRAKAEGYRSRAAYKLLELDERFGFVKGKGRIVDLGCAPGGWVQVLRQKVPGAGVVGIDLLPVEPLEGATFLEMDFNDAASEDALISELGGAPDLILSDMAANTTGHQKTDHLRTIALVELAVDFALRHLAPGGDFVAKVFAGGADREVLEALKRGFESVRHAKPPASRKESVETYVVARGRKAEKSS